MLIEIGKKVPCRAAEKIRGSRTPFLFVFLFFLSFVVRNRRSKRIQNRDIRTYHHRELCVYWLYMSVKDGVLLYSYCVRSFWRVSVGLLPAIFFFSIGDRVFHEIRGEPAVQLLLSTTLSNLNLLWENTVKEFRGCTKMCPITLISPFKLIIQQNQWRNL